MLMIVLILVILGLCAGSFVNALVWRLHEQERLTDHKKANKKLLQRLSISRGRSMCPHCHHELAGKDLVPLFSWVVLKGKCRYCHKSISAQYPLVELACAGLFVASYVGWPAAIEGEQVTLFTIWLVLLTGLLALLVYDLRWLLLPNRIMYPLGGIALIYAFSGVLAADRPHHALLNVFFAVAIGGGIFYLLFQVSQGKWIGGGDVKLGWLLGLLVGSPAKAFLLLFLASFLGSLVSLPLLATGRLKRTSTIPFGPFLITAAIITVLFGTTILNWYRDSILLLG